jgi:hypothetical protein
VTAIDRFLASLAEDCRERAVGVLLSGTGAHGTLMIRLVQFHRGLQSSTAEHVRYTHGLARPPGLRLGEEIVRGFQFFGVDAHNQVGSGAASRSSPYGAPGSVHATESGWEMENEPR